MTMFFMKLAKNFVNSDKTEENASPTEEKK